MAVWLIAIYILILVAGNVLPVAYLTFELFKRRLTAKKFALAINLGIGLSVSIDVLIALASTSSFTLTAIGFALMIVTIHLVIGFPLVYFVTNRLFLINAFYEFHDRLEYLHRR